MNPVSPVRCAARVLATALLLAATVPCDAGSREHATRDDAPADMAARACALRETASADSAPLQMKTLEGREVSLQDLHGEVVVLNFWATWCKPCITEMPVLAKLAQRFGTRGLRVIAASVDETASHEQLEQFADRLPNAMEVWVGATMADIQRMRVQALPTTVIIDREGTLIQVHHGMLGEGSLDDTLEKLLDSSSPERNPAPRPAPNRRRFSEASEA